MAQALHACFGVPAETRGVSFAGRTDRGITESLFTAHQIEITDANVDSFYEAYLERLPRALEESPGSVLAGVHDWLDQIRDAGGSLGLLTGNMTSAARIKLQHFRLWDYFAFGGYGDTDRDRNMVAKRAFVAAEKALSRKVSASQVWVVGDTPHDVTCARSQDFNVIGVATGGHSREELLIYEPDIALKTLYDGAVLCKILSRTPGR